MSQIALEVGRPEAVWFHALPSLRDLALAAAAAAASVFSFELAACCQSAAIIHSGGLLAAAQASRASNRVLVC